jgi:hypothetical protein
MHINSEHELLSPITLLLLKLMLMWSVSVSTALHYRSWYGKLNIDLFYRVYTLFRFLFRI